MNAPVGARGAEYEMVVERGKIAEFATAMQSEDPAYRGPDAVVPPTFLTNGALWAPEGARVGRHRRVRGLPRDRLAVS